MAHVRKPYPPKQDASRREPLRLVSAASRCPWNLAEHNTIRLQHLLKLLGIVPELGGTCRFMDLDTRPWIHWIREDGTEIRLAYGPLSAGCEWVKMQIGARVVEFNPQHDSLERIRERWQ